MDNKERFISLCNKVDRKGMPEFLKWIEETTDFFTAPASSRFHGAYEGGLLEHSLNVFDELTRLMKAYPEIEAPEESVIICSLLHDLCKVNMYAIEKKWKKDLSNNWEAYDAYVIKEQFCYGGHGSKSVYLTQHFMELTPQEAVAIQCHMGSWEEGAAKTVGGAFEQFPFAWLLHVADESACYIEENTKIKFNTNKED